MSYEKSAGNLYKLEALECFLEACSENDKEGFYTIYQEVISAGTNYPYDDESREEFQRCFFGRGSMSMYANPERINEVIGGFNLEAELYRKG